MCEFEGDNGSFICEVDEEGWGRCGDAVINDDGEFCVWANEVLEWQDIKPEHLKAGTSR